MNIYMLLFFISFFAGVIGALLLLKTKEWALLFGGIFLTLIGCVPSMGMILDSDVSKDLALKLVGESLVVFFSILGGAIVSSAWSELRAKYNKEKPK